MADDGAILLSPETYDRFDEAAGQVLGAGRAPRQRRLASGSTEEIFTARCTSSTPDGDGYYDAVITLYDVNANTWTDYDAIKIAPINSEGFEADKRYCVTPAGDDGTNAIYILSGGREYPYATTTVDGIVSTVVQMFGGAKGCQETIDFGGNPWTTTVTLNTHDTSFGVSTDFVGTAISIQSDYAAGGFQKVGKLFPNALVLNRSLDATETGAPTAVAIEGSFKGLYFELIQMQPAINSAQLYVDTVGSNQTLFLLCGDGPLGSYWQPAYGVRANGASYWGQWGSLVDGSMVNGGIITSIGSGGSTVTASSGFSTATKWGGPT